MEKPLVWVLETRTSATTKKKGLIMSTLLPCTDKTELFFPEFGEVQKKTMEAKALCATCPMVVACLNLALKDNQKYGVWGGATVQERAKMKRNPAFKNEHLMNLMEGVRNAISQNQKPNR